MRLTTVQDARRGHVQEPASSRDRRTVVNSVLTCGKLVGSASFQLLRRRISRDRDCPLADMRVSIFGDALICSIACLSIVRISMNIRYGRCLPLFVLIAISRLVVGDDTELRHNELFQKKFEHLQMAVVRVDRVESNGDLRTFGTGVIVSREGHIVVYNTTTPVFRPILPGDTLSIHFADQSSLEAVTLGWSEEFRIAMAKISANGPFQFAEISHHDDIRPGIPCLSLGYVLLDHRYSRVPVMTTGNITTVGSQQWLSSSCETMSFDAIFDMRGRLLGITTVRPVGSDSFQTQGAAVLALWPELVSSKNIDWERATALSMRREPLNGTALELADDTALPLQRNREIAERTTVLICDADDKETQHCWSGVVVSRAGHIATCAHHHLMPGKPVVVRLSDGRRVRGKVLGSNTITDIGLVQITDEGEWPCAKISMSGRLKAGDSCVESGYPADYDKRTPVVRQTAVVATDTYKWTCEMLTDGDDYDLRPGESGGGVFDDRGGLIGIHVGKNPGGPGRHMRIEFFILQWNDLIHQSVTP